MKRELTVGAGLNELDKMQTVLSEMRSVEPEETPPPLPPGAAAASSLGSRSSRSPMTPQLAASGLVAALSGVVGLYVQPPMSSDGAVVPTWAAIVAVLVVVAVLALGADAAADIGREWRARPPLGSRVPLTDTALGIKTANKFANSAQVREKGLKIVQYLLRGAAYSGLLRPEAGKHLRALSKTTSIARRFFKFCRWVKHFEDLGEAREQKAPVMRALLYVRIFANFGADWAEDACSLERMGILPAGTLGGPFMLFAEHCQLVLALVEIWVTTVRARKEKELHDLAKGVGADAESLKAQRRKVALVRLELVKFVSDLGKAFFDCELAFSHEGVFIGCSLFSALLSTHKNMVKVLKQVK